LRLRRGSDWGCRGSGGGGRRGRGGRRRWRLPSDGGDNNGDECERQKTFPIH